MISDLSFKMLRKLFCKLCLCFKYHYSKGGVDRGATTRSRAGGPRTKAGKTGGLGTATVTANQARNEHIRSVHEPRIRILEGLTQAYS